MGLAAGNNELRSGQQWFYVVPLLPAAGLGAANNGFGPVHNGFMKYHCYPLRKNCSFYGIWVVLKSDRHCYIVKIDFRTIGDIFRTIGQCFSIKIEKTFKISPSESLCRQK
jgi:hypothetical protein